jgi:Kef-type K+ transport system membrane component KefB/Trk K+ transport system NAD-binding subunit
MSENIFLELALILALATITSILGQKLRQPLIIMFLASGILAGPACFGIIKSYHEIELLANMGIALLLFIVGLKLDLHLIRTTGPVALATGLGQIFFTCFIGFFIALSMDMAFLPAAYVSVALTFSSTIIIVKLLSDKKEIDSLHGQIAIGFLIVQDIAAILALIGLTIIGAPVVEGESMYIQAMLILAKGIGMLAIVALLIKYILPFLTKRLAQSPELLTLFAVAWAVFFGATGELLGFTKEVGAFLAGVSLASTDFRDSIGARLAGLRDFLLLFFFIYLGARLDWTTVGSQIEASLIFSVFVLIGNPLIVMLIMRFMGYRHRTGFLAGLTVAQISEFSLIVAAIGLSLGHISNEIMGLITLVGVITIFLSTYMILYSSQLYNFLSGYLKIFELRNPYRERAIDTYDSPISTEIILVGLGNYGSGLAEYLLRRDKIILGVDFDPGVLDKWRKKGVPVLYGDMSDPEMHEHLPLNEVEWLISTVRSKDINLTLINNLKKTGYKGKIAITAGNENEMRIYEEVGVHLVFQPFKDATEQAVDALSYATEVLPKEINWPVSFLEVRIKSDSAVVGRKIHNIPLRSKAGVSILAISRGGRVFFDPESDFILYPGDRVLVTGSATGLKNADKVLNQLGIKENRLNNDRFEIAEVCVGEHSEFSGKSIMELGFRQKYKVTLIGIRRGTFEITHIQPSEKIMSGDRLIFIGKSGAVKRLKNQEL